MAKKERLGVRQNQALQEIVSQLDMNERVSAARILHEGVAAGLPSNAPFTVVGLSLDRSRIFGLISIPTPPAGAQEKLASIMERLTDITRPTE